MLTEDRAPTYRMVPRAATSLWILDKDSSKDGALYREGHVRLFSSGSYAALPVPLQPPAPLLFSLSSIAIWRGS